MKERISRSLPVVVLLPGTCSGPLNEPSNNADSTGYGGDKWKIESSELGVSQYKYSSRQVPVPQPHSKVHVPGREVTGAVATKELVLTVIQSRDREITDTETGNLILRSLYVTSNQNFRNLVNWNRASVGISNQLP